MRTRCATGLRYSPRSDETLPPGVSAPAQPAPYDAGRAAGPTRHRHRSARSVVDHPTGLGRVDPHLHVLDPLDVLDAPRRFAGRKIGRGIVLVELPVVRRVAAAVRRGTTAGSASSDAASR